jgi:hypothetical protein
MSSLIQTKHLALAIVLQTLFSTFVFAQGNTDGMGKHPRVAEIENGMVKDATTFLKSRFPNLPFLVSVSVDPLRRIDGVRKEDSGDRLPYFEDSDEEIKDEWDNPNVSSFALMARIKKASITVSVSSNVTDEEISEVRTSLIQVLNLIPARDEVVIQKRAWSQLQDSKPDSQTVILFSALGFGAVLIALGGLFFITRSSVREIGSAIGTGAAKAGGGAVSSSGPSSGPALASETVDGRSTGVGAGGDVKFSDPLKMREVVSQTVRGLNESATFPNLQDLILLDRVGKKNPAVLGALLLEFSDELQRRLFSYSYQTHWLQAMTDPGEITSEVLELLGRLVRNQRSAEALPLQNVLIYVWRLDEQMAPFLRSIEQDEAFAILSHLPKTVSLSAARAAFPGNWGTVLDTQFKPKLLSKERLEKIAAKAIQAKALRDFSILDQYRQERDLLEYLMIADPVEEKEVYLASPSQSVIHHMRPPFYKAFELSSEELDLIVPKVSLDDWSLALFNTNRASRREIEKKFTDKQKFVFIEKLRKFDQNPPDKLRVGAARERLARFIQARLAERTDVSNVEASQATKKVSNENQAA